MVDKNLFPYNLSIMTIMKGEAPYVKEWLDYHLLAGVDHFFIYDNESPDNLKEILQPYIDAGIVTYIFYPGKCRQMESYIDAAKKFRFLSRYIAWIDADEFIFPKSKSTIVEVVDEIFSAYPQASGLSVNLHAYGSNGQDTADYNRGVLERFTRRAGNDWTPPVSWAPSVKGGTATVKSIVNPRRVKLFTQPHAPNYFDTCSAINENGNAVQGFSSFPVSTEKIVMNHYTVKSKEEYANKVQRGNADWEDNRYSMKGFSHDKYNDEFDDGILKYRDARQSALLQNGGVLKLFFILNALTMYAFLTCWRKI